MVKRSNSSRGSMEGSSKRIGFWRIRRPRNYTRLDARILQQSITGLMGRKTPRIASEPVSGKTPRVGIDPTSFDAPNPSWRIRKLEMVDPFGWHEVSKQT